jgi:hypothetical protein
MTCVGGDATGLAGCGEPIDDGSTGGIPGGGDLPGGVVSVGVAVIAGRFVEGAMQVLPRLSMADPSEWQLARWLNRQLRQLRHRSLAHPRRVRVLNLLAAA